MKPNFNGRFTGQTVGSWVWNGSSWYNTNSMGSMGSYGLAGLSSGMSPAAGGYSVGGGNMANLMGTGPTSGGVPIGNNINRLMDIPAAFNSTPRFTPRPEPQFTLPSPPQPAKPKQTPKPAVVQPKPPEPDMVYEPMQVRVDEYNRQAEEIRQTKEK